MPTLFGSTIARTINPLRSQTLAGATLVMRTMFRVGIATALLLTCAPAFAQVTIHWAPSAAGHAGDLKAPTQAPNGTTTTVSESSYLYLVNFNKGKIIERKYENLGKLLGVSEQELAMRWDILAFEGNSHQTKGGGWESSIWFVTDMVGAAAGSFNGDLAEKEPSPTSPMRFKSGSIPAADYMKFFGIKEFKTAAGKPVAWASWVLLDVPDGIDVKSERFRLWVSGALVGSPGLGNPDPDAFGVIIH